MARYKVNGKIYERLSSARREAEWIMAGLSDDDAIFIDIETDEDDGSPPRWEPYGRIVRDRKRFVLKR